MKSPIGRRVLACAFAALMLAPAAPASADSFHVGPWDLYESWATWTWYYETGSRDRYRWVEDTAHSTEMALHYPYNGSRIGDSVVIPAHYQDYVDMGCYCSNYVTIQLRGRSRYGTQYNRDGNLIL